MSGCVEWQRHKYNASRLQEFFNGWRVVTDNKQKGAPIKTLAKHSMPTQRIIFIDNSYAAADAVKKTSPEVETYVIVRHRDFLPPQEDAENFSSMLGNRKWHLPAHHIITSLGEIDLHEGNLHVGNPARSATSNH